MVLRESITQNCALHDVRNDSNPLGALKNIGFTFTQKRRANCQFPPRDHDHRWLSLFPSLSRSLSSTYCKIKSAIA